MRSVLAIALAALAAVPALLLRFGTLGAPVEVATLCYGLAIVGAAFAISWAAEAAERDVPRALALTVVALLAVLPEYAVDIVFAFKAGIDPSFAPFAAANMTGSNRLLLGLGWPTVAVLAWVAHGQRRIRLTRDAVLPLLFLALATVYSFSLPLRASISPVDSVVLIALFVVYAGLAARQQTEEPHLIGPAASIGSLPTVPRRLAILALFAFAGTVIAASAEPFAEGLVHTGARLGIDEFLLVQWLAPLASESPEFLVAALLAVRGKGVAGMTLLLSAKVNQWTLLVGSLPLAFSWGAGHLAALPLDARQTSEVLLTAAQSLFGIAVLASLSFELSEAVLLASIFVVQFAVGALLRGLVHASDAASLELYLVSAVYIGLSLLLLWHARRTLLRLLRGDRTVVEPAEWDAPAKRRHAA